MNGARSVKSSLTVDKGEKEAYNKDTDTTARRAWCVPF